MPFLTPPEEIKVNLSLYGRDNLRAIGVGTPQSLNNSPRLELLLLLLST